MAISTLTALFRSDIAEVWRTVTSVESYSWRSDLEKTERLDDKRFKEYTADGFVTEFTVTLCRPLERWEFDMENGNIKGHWTGVFEADGGGTKVVFSENVSAKKAIMRPLLKPYLKRQQRLFVRDLKRALGE